MYTARAVSLFSKDQKAEEVPLLEHVGHHAIVPVDILPLVPKDTVSQEFVDSPQTQQECVGLNNKDKGLEELREDGGSNNNNNALECLRAGP